MMVWVKVFPSPRGLFLVSSCSFSGGVNMFPPPYSVTIVFNRIHRYLPSNITTIDCSLFPSIGFP